MLAFSAGLTMMFLLCLGMFLPLCNGLDGGMLYPRESESRQIQELNGMWNFRVDRTPGRNAGFSDNWFKQKLSQVKSELQHLID